MFFPDLPQSVWHKLIKSFDGVEFLKIWNVQQGCEFISSHFDTHHLKNLFLSLNVLVLSSFSMFYVLTRQVNIFRRFRWCSHPEENVVQSSVSHTGLYQAKCVNDKVFSLKELSCDEFSQFSFLSLRIFQAARTRSTFTTHKIFPPTLSSYERGNIKRVAMLNSEPI